MGHLIFEMSLLLEISFISDTMISFNESNSALTNLMPLSISEDKNIAQAVALLKAGETVAFPTETVYGLGADASNPKAIQKIFEIKGRPSNHPLIVHIADASKLEVWADNIPEQAWLLAKKYWPGPLTLILPRKSNVPLEVTGGQETIGLRVPDHPIALALLQAFDGGVAAPSANHFGCISPTTAQHVKDGLGAAVGMILDGGPCRIGLESTIVSFINGEICLLRPGGLSLEQIEETLHQKLTKPNATHKVRAPGMLASHYSPKTPLSIIPIENLETRAKELSSLGLNVAIIRLGETKKSFFKNGVTTIILPSIAFEYGHQLYATLHQLDYENYDHLLAEALPSTKEWLAVNDRISRAAHER